MRILFHAPGLAAFRPDLNLPHILGLQTAAPERLVDLKPTHQLTGNRGNIIHAEAPVKIFDRDPKKSVYGNIATLQATLGAGYRETIANNFDMIIVSMANFIRPDHDGARLASALTALDGVVPFIILGAGLQGNHPLSAMLPGNRDLLAVMNERAAVFGVRGAMTHAWLTENGFSRATVLGCPSLYAFPQSILSIDGAAARAKGAAADVMTAGHLSLRGDSIVPRGLELARAFRDIKASYVFQDEFFAYGAGLPEQPFSYNEGNQTSPAGPLNAWLSQKCGQKVNFERYYYFTEAGAWRQAGLRHDVFIGDRFHGGVAVLQAGQPAIFLKHDNRVSELTNHFGLPALTTQEFAQKGLKATMDQYLSDDALARMKKIYRQRHAEFSAIMAKHGLKVMNNLPGQEAAKGKRPEAASIISVGTSANIAPEPALTELNHYTLRRFHPSGARDLVINFEGEAAERSQKARQGFDEAFLLEQGYAVLSVLTHTTHWYRAPGIREYFTSAQFQSWLKGFDSVQTYGSSMGAHAACLFAGVLGCRNVVALQPVSTLAADLVPWERRFAYGRTLDWSGTDRDAVLGLGNCPSVYAVYDPGNPDARHIARFTAVVPEKMRLIEVPGAEHAVPRHLAGRGLLKDVTTLCLQGADPQQIRARLAR